MNQEESIALWRRGKDAWNSWAEGMLRQKAELEKSGSWNGDKSEHEWSDETRKWSEAAQTDLSRLRFMTRALADTAAKQAGQHERSRPADADVKTVIIEGNTIDFSGFVFPWRTHFGDVQFHEWASFVDVQFHGLASFLSAHFHEWASFEGATQFHGHAGFGQVQFHGEEAVFEGVQFHGKASFHRAQFQGQALFASANFERSAWFNDALFGSAADFTAIKSDRAFDLSGAQFSKVPAFNQADFKQAPDLGDVTYPQPPFFRFYVKRLEPNPEYGKPNEPKKKEAQGYAAVRGDAAKYRHLRRLAILGYDHENEVRAFKGETRAKRGTEHLPWHAAFWFGLGYDLFSDFGRSMMRPFYAGVVLTMLFAGVYLLNAGYAPNQWWSACPTPSQATLMSKALSLSFGNALPVVASARGEETKAIYTCLYGGADKGGVFPIPTWSPFLQGAQNVLSAFLIFLFLLGVRNQFKIK